MQSYSYIAELVVLPIIVTIMLSLRKDAYTKSLQHKYLVTMYRFAFLSSFMTCMTSFFNNPLDSDLKLVCGYVVDTIYFMVVPSTAIMFGLYVKYTSSGTFNKITSLKKHLPMLTPYIIYLLFLVINIFNGMVFEMTKEVGYVRGPLYEITYPLVGIYGVIVVVSVIKNFNYVPKETSKTILVTAVTALLIIGMLFYNSGVILTGLLSTMCVLSIHLHVLNNSSKEDMITGTQNRLSFLNELRKEVELKKHFSIYIFSIRGMKHVNEQYGLHIGDKKLFNIAQVILDHVRRERVFRYSGDEFALILPYDKENKSPIIQNIINDFKKPTIVEGNIHPIEIVTLRIDYPTFGTHVSDLIAVIDYGVRLIKEGNDNSIKYLYDISVADAMRIYHKTMHQLRIALDNKQFVVHYQPIYHTPSKTFTEAEALIRIKKEDGTLIYPNSFIEVANNTGLITEMTYRLLEEVCKDLHNLFIQNPKTTLQAISINVPYLQFTDPNMEQRFIETLNKYNILPNQIKIEVTERVVVSNFEMMINKMKRFIEIGFLFELDDFGTGYSNIKTALSLPTDIVKLDRSLLLSAVNSNEEKLFLKHLAEGINVMGKTSLFEGVETKEQLEIVMECGCEYIQGYYFSKPIEFERFSKFLE